MTHRAVVDVTPSHVGAVDVLRGDANASFGEGAVTLAPRHVIVGDHAIGTPIVATSVYADVVVRVGVSGEVEDKVVEVLSALAGLPSAPEPFVHVQTILDLACAATRVGGGDPDRVQRLLSDWLEGDPVTYSLLEPTPADRANGHKVRSVYAADEVWWAARAGNGDWVPCDRGAILMARWVPKALDHAVKQEQR